MGPMTSHANAVAPPLDTPTMHSVVEADDGIIGTANTHCRVGGCRPQPADRLADASVTPNVESLEREGGAD